MSPSSFDRKSLAERCAELVGIEMGMDMIHYLEKFDSWDDDVEEYLRLNPELILPGEDENNALRRIRGEIRHESIRYRV